MQRVVYSQVHNKDTLKTPAFTRGIDRKIERSVVSVPQGKIHQTECGKWVGSVQTVEIVLYFHTQERRIFQ